MSNGGIDMMLILNFNHFSRVSGGQLIGMKTNKRRRKWIIILTLAPIFTKNRPREVACANKPFKSIHLTSGLKFWWQNYYRKSFFASGSAASKTVFNCYISCRDCRVAFMFINMHEIACEREQRSEKKSYKVFNVSRCVSCFRGCLSITLRCLIAVLSANDVNERKRCNNWKLKSASQITTSLPAREEAITIRRMRRRFWRKF